MSKKHKPEVQKQTPPEPVKDLEAKAAPDKAPEPVNKEIKIGEKTFQTFTQINVMTANSTTVEALVLPGKGVVIAARNYGICFLPAVKVNGNHLV